MGATSLPLKLTMSIAVGIAGLLLKAAAAVGATGAVAGLIDSIAKQTGKTANQIRFEAGIEQIPAREKLKNSMFDVKTIDEIPTRNTQKTQKTDEKDVSINELPTLERTELKKKTFNAGTLEDTQVEETPSVSEAIDETPSAGETIDETPSTGTPMGAIDEIEKTESETSNNGGSEGFNSMQAWEDWYLARREEEWEREDKLRKEQQARDDSAYQRAVEDMKAAGVNPNLIGAINTNYGTSFTQQATGGDYGSGNLLDKEQIDIDRVFNEAKIELQKIGLDRDMINNILGGLVKLIAAGM